MEIIDNVFDFQLNETRVTDENAQNCRNAYSNFKILIM